MNTPGLAITLAISWLLTASAATAEPLPDPGQVMELVYVETNIDASAGGHLALRISHQVYHYQAVGSRLLLVREPWRYFQDFYQQLENRGLKVATLDLDPGQQRAIESHFNRQLVVQQQQLRREQLLFLERDWYALASGEGGELNLAGMGYFLPLSRAAAAPQRDAGDISWQLGKVRRALATLEPASIIQPGNVSRGGTSGVPAASLEERESLLQLQAALSLMDYGIGLNPENLVYLERAVLSHSERQLLEQYETELEAALARLLRSSRQGRGYPLLISHARLLAVRESLARGHWVFLNSFPRIPDGASATRSAGQSEVWTRLSQQIELAWQLVRSREANTNAYSDQSYSRLETAASRFYESSRNPASIAVTQGWRPGLLMPQRMGAWWVEPDSPEVTPLDPDGRALRYSASLERAYSYRLFNHNCVTALADALNEGAGLAGNVELVLGHGLDAGSGLDFIPRLMFDQAIATLNISSVRYQPSRREQIIATMLDAQPAWQVGLRESNTWTAQAYHGSINDDAFLFFTDGNAWLRPALGVANVTYAALTSGMGIFSAPFDGGERLSDGIRGMLYSAPELVFINLRKGQYDSLP